MDPRDERLDDALTAWWEASGRREEMVKDIATELLARVSSMQDEITRARRALAEADGALLDVLAAMGIPSRPASVTSIRPPRE